MNSMVNLGGGYSYNLYADFGDPLKTLNIYEILYDFIIKVALYLLWKTNSKPYIYRQHKIIVVDSTYEARIATLF